ncbi:MAG: hypothetical protein ACREIT_02950, partial [Tepidisphaeraceae bacterium]
TWAYHPQPGVKYRADRPGRIGANLVDCEYYYLRAMLKNRAAYTGPAMDDLIGKSARRSMSLAFMEGTPQEFVHARQIAWPHLSRVYRMFYATAAVAGGPLRGAVRVKRKWFSTRVS